MGIAPGSGGLSNSWTRDSLPAMPGNIEQRLRTRHAGLQNNRRRRFMPGRVEGKRALVVGGGQTPGEGAGNGRAVAVLLAREGARVVVADRDLVRAEDTVALIHAEGGEASAIQCDVTSEEDVGGAIAETLARLGGLDILHNNVGASIALGDAPAIDLTEAAFDRSFAVNL